MFICENIPEDLTAYVEKFRECRNCDVCIAINTFNKVKYIVNENNLFVEDIDYINERCSEIIKYIIINVSNGLTSTTYVLCGISNHDENVLYRMATTNYEVVEKILYKYIKRNVSEYNYNFDLWTPMFESDMSMFKYEPDVQQTDYISRETGEIVNVSRPLSFNDVNDVIYRLYSMTHCSDSEFEMEPEVAEQFINSIGNVINELRNHAVERETGDSDNDDEGYNAQFDILYENNRNRIINETYNFTHKEHKLCVHDDKNVNVSDDMKSCLLCYEDSDYVCSNCGFPICCNCMDKLRLQLHVKCPNCQCEPIKFYNIANRNKFSELNSNNSNSKCEN